MIARLKGVIDSYGEDFIVVDVHGVGYLVHCSARTLQALPGVGEAVTLAIETHVREDQIRLFGFLSDVEREWFRLLQTVQGVGTNVGARIMTERKDKAPAYSAIDPAVVRLSGALDESRAPRPVADAVSALVNLGYGQPQAAAAVAAATRAAGEGEGADTARLIRAALKELAR
jgi:Holliday junction DNA helicase RuvA